MEYLDARRLTGPNVLWNKSGSILDIACTADEADQVILYCESLICRMLEAVGWGDESTPPCNARWWRQYRVLGADRCPVCCICDKRVGLGML